MNLGYVSIADGHDNSGDIGDVKLDPNEILVDNEIIRIRFEYPFNNPQIIKFKSDKGYFTRSDIIKLVVKKYQKIYEEEEKSTALPIETVEERTKGKSKLMNRATTNGKWGIWGHDIGDLMLHTLSVNDEDPTLYYLGIDS